MDGTEGKPTGRSNHGGGRCGKMTLLSVCNLVGLPGLPSTAFGIRKWLKRNDIALIQDGNRFAFSLSDLPPEVRRAVIERDIAAALKS